MGAKTHRLFSTGQKTGRQWLHKVLLIFTVVLALTSNAVADRSNATKYFPEEVIFGMLNLLKGVNFKDALDTSKIAFDRMITHQRHPDTRIKTMLVSDVHSAARKMRRKELHILILSTGDYLTLRELVPTIPILISSHANTPAEPYLLVAQKGLQLSELADLPRRRLRIEQNASRRIDMAWLESILNKHGLPPANSYFSVIRPAANPARTILPVFFGQAEACLVRQSAFFTMVELNPQVGRKLAVLERSPDFAHTITCVAAYLDEALIGYIIQDAMDMDKIDAGRQLLMIAKINRNFLYKPEYLTEVEKLLTDPSTGLASKGRNERGLSPLSQKERRN